MEANKTIHEKISVFVRVRPSSLASSKRCIQKLPDGLCSYNHRVTAQTSESIQPMPRQSLFPLICLDDSFLQDHIFDTVAKPIVDSVISGYNGTVLAYGPTNRYCL